MRKVQYISGTRADFGLMRRALAAIAAHPALDLGLAVTGMHLSPRYGSTVADIDSDGLRIDCRLPVDLAETTGEAMARNLGTMVGGFASHFAHAKPDIVLLLGDRGEMLAGAIAALHLNIAIAHVHGGERSGTIDEPMRHAVSKLAHLHLTTIAEARERLIRMGERADCVTVVGAPGVEGLSSGVRRTKAELCREFGFDPARPVVLFVYHPVVQEAASAGQGAAMLLDLLAARDVQVVALKPNSDAGGDAIAWEIDKRGANPTLRVVTHFPRDAFVDWMAACDLMLGNTSAGIIEAASFGTPVVNVGSRQQLRARNANTTDVPLDRREVESAIDRALQVGRFACANIYEQPDTAAHIADVLAKADLGPALLDKVNSY